jgi:MFS family permease
VLLNLLSGLGWAGIAVAGNTTVANLAPVGSEGAAVGAYTSFVSIGSIAGALVSGFLVLLIGFEWVYVLGAIGIGFTMIVLGLVRKAAPEGAHV